MKLDNNQVDLTSGEVTAKALLILKLIQVKLII